jgi:hypothetical protein
MKATCRSETSVDSQRTTRRYISEHFSLPFSHEPANGLSWTIWIQFTPSHISLRSILILSFLESYVFQAVSVLQDNIGMQSDRPNNVWWRVRIIELIITQFSPPSSHFLPSLGPNIPLSNPFSNSLSLCSSLIVRDQVSHPHKTTSEVLCFSLCVLSEKTNDSGLNGSKRALKLIHACTPFCCFLADYFVTPLVARLHMRRKVKLRSSGMWRRVVWQIRTQSCSRISSWRWRRRILRNSTKNSE